MEMKDSKAMMLPPGCNWFGSKVLDVSDNNQCAYGTKNEICLIQLAQQQHPLSVIALLPGHTDRVHALAFQHMQQQKHIQMHNEMRNQMHDERQQWQLSQPQIEALQVSSASSSASASASSASSSASLLASASSDGTVRVWDTDALVMLASHSLHQKSAVNAVTWLPFHQSQILSGDKSGTLIMWNHVSGDSSKFSLLDRTAITVISASLFSNIIAVGFQNGVIVVASLQPGGGSQILQKLKGHDDEVQCLKWSTLIRGLRAQPAEGMKSGSSEKPNKQTEAKGKRKAKRNHSEVASQQPDPSQHQVDPAGKKAKLEPPLNPGNQRIDVEAPEKTTPEPGNLVPEPEESPLPPMIYLASSSRDKTLRVWNPENGQMSWVLNLPREGGGGGNDAKSRQWTSVDWSHPSRLELIFFGGNGGLYQWNPDTNDPPKKLSSPHSRTVFDISITMDRSKMITSSMDRQTVVWDLASRKPEIKIPGLGGFVYSLDVAECDPTKLAIGVGDSSIRVWNLGNPANPYDTIYLWKGLQSKVTCVAWHPVEEGVLAFGTDDGHFGSYEISSSKYVHFQGHHQQKAVYSLGWRSLAGEKYLLYSCGGDGLVLESDPKAPQKPSKNILGLLGSSNSQVKRTELHFLRAGEALAIGNDDGSIDVYLLPTFAQVYHCAAHKGLINKLRWNNTVKSKVLLASASEDGTVAVHDLTRILSADSASGVVNALSPFRTLKAHTKSVTSVSWSSDQTLRLATASADGTALIWDVEEGSITNTLLGHLGKVFTVVWSLTDPESVFTGSEDQTVRAWNLTEAKNQGKSLGSSSTPSPRPRHAPSQKPTQPKREANKGQGHQREPALLGSTAPPPQPAKKLRTLFPNSNPSNEPKGSTQETCSKISRQPLAENSGLPMSSAFFGGFSDLSQMISVEEASHRKQQNVEANLALGLFQGNFGPAVEFALEKNLLLENPHLLALAPLAGIDVWKKLMLRAAEQLESKGETHQAALYFLAIDEVRRAVMAYQRGEHFREAVALARLRLSPQDSLIQEIYSAWGHHLESKSQFEQAAKCFLVSGEAPSALRALDKRTDLQSQRFTLSLAEEMHSPELDERKIMFALGCVCRDEFRQAEDILSTVNPQGQAADKASALFLMCTIEQSIEPAFKNGGLLKTTSPVPRNITNDQMAQHVLNNSPVSQRLIGAWEASPLLSNRSPAQIIQVLRENQIFLIDGRASSLQGRGQVACLIGIALALLKDSRWQEAMNEVSHFEALLYRGSQFHESLELLEIFAPRWRDDVLQSFHEAATLSPALLSSLSFGILSWLQLLIPKFSANLSQGQLGQPSVDGLANGQGVENQQVQTAFGSLGESDMLCGLLDLILPPNRSRLRVVESLLEKVRSHLRQISSSLEETLAIANQPSVGQDLDLISLEKSLGTLSTTEAKSLAASLLEEQARLVSAIGPHPSPALPEAAKILALVAVPSNNRKILSALMAWGALYSVDEQERVYFASLM